MKTDLKKENTENSWKEKEKIFFQNSLMNDYKYEKTSVNMLTFILFI